MLIPDDLQDEEDVVLAQIRAGETVDHYETIRAAQGRHHAGDFADRLADPRRAMGEIVGASKIARDITERTRGWRATPRSTRSNTEKLGEVGAVVASTLDRETIVQKVTDIATELTHARVRRVLLQRDATTNPAILYMLYALSGRAARGVRVSFRIRARPRSSRRPFTAKASSGSTTSPRIRATARIAPYFGMPPGHLPVRSYLAVPVKGIGGQ